MNALNTSQFDCDALYDHDLAQATDRVGHDPHSLQDVEAVAQ